jgi:hypothetical protein
MMTNFTMISKMGRGIAAAPLCVLLMSGTAHAALTADQVWQSWKNAGALVGLTVSAATEARDGGSLMLNGVTVAGAEGAGLTISDMVLAEQGDGSVTITPGADIGMDYTGPNGDLAKLDVIHDSLTITARDDNGALVYDYAATSVNAEFNSSYVTLGTEGEAAAPQATTVAKVVFEGLAGTYSDTPGTNRAFGMDLTASKLGYDITSDFPELPMKTTSVSETADVVIGFDVTMPQTVSLMALQSASEFQKALQEGFAFTGTTKQGLSTGSSSQESGFMPYAMEMTAQSGEANFAFDKDKFAVQSTGAGLEVNFTSAMMPVPVKVTSGPIEVNMVSPVTAGETAGDFALLMKVSQFTVNDEAWAMMDPGGALKRDPADLSIDVSGKGKIDFLAMAIADETGEVPPVPAPESLDIKDLSLKIAGAAFAATGAFTFDNSSGVPMPLGEANVSLTGGNALIDGLIATGIVTEEDAMGARMMMGMFFTPGADADSLTSKIEAKAGNEIYVNGQRIQ